MKSKTLLEYSYLEFTEVVVCRCFSKYVFLKISLYSLENTCVGVAYLKRFFLESLFLNFIKKRPQRRCFPGKITKFLRTAFFRTPLATASEFLTKLAENNCERKSFLSRAFLRNFLVIISY